LSPRDWPPAALLTPAHLLLPELSRSLPEPFGLSSSSSIHNTQLSSTLDNGIRLRCRGIPNRPPPSNALEPLRKTALVVLSCAVMIDLRPLRSRAWWKIGFMSVLLDISTPSRARGILPFYLVVAGWTFCQNVACRPHCGAHALLRFHFKALIDYASS
jgi:hypothetical protein